MEKYPNDDEVVNLEIDGDQYELKRHNTEVYRFLGRFAVYNHIYHAPDDDESVVYLFEYMPRIKELAEILIAKMYPLHSNILQPLKTDIQIYEDIALEELHQDIEDFEEFGME